MTPNELVQVVGERLREEKAEQVRCLILKCEAARASVAELHTHLYGALLPTDDAQVA